MFANHFFSNPVKFLLLNVLLFIYKKIADFKYFVILTKKLLIPMTVENAYAYIESMIQNGPSDDLHAQINVKFKSEHIHQALKERGTSKD